MDTPELDLLQGTLNVLVLRALSWHPMHGYAVARFIRDGSGERFRILDGALYTALHRMEELELGRVVRGGSPTKVSAPSSTRSRRPGAARCVQKPNDGTHSVTAVHGVMHAKPEPA